MEDLIKHNPYRILDISIDATNGEAIKKNKYLLNLIKISGDTEANDIFSMFSKITITKNSISNSSNSLNNFRDRLKYRLFWFNYKGNSYKLFGNDYNYNEYDVIDRHFLAVLNHGYIITYIYESLMENIDIKTIKEEVNKFKDKFKINNFLEYWDILDDFDFYLYFKKLEENSDYPNELQVEDYEEVLNLAKNEILNSIEEIACRLLEKLDTNLSLYLYECVNKSSLFEDDSLRLFNSRIKEKIENLIIDNCENTTVHINSIYNEEHKDVISSNCLNAYDYIKNKVMPLMYMFQKINTDRIECLQCGDCLAKVLNGISIAINNKLKDYGTSLLILWDAYTIDIYDENFKVNLKDNISTIEENLLYDFELKCTDILNKIDDSVQNPQDNLVQYFDNIYNEYSVNIKNKFHLLDIIRTNEERVLNIKESIALLLYRLAVECYADKLYEYEKSIKILYEADDYAKDKTQQKKLILEGINIFKDIMEKEKLHFKENRTDSASSSKDNYRNNNTSYNASGGKSDSSYINNDLKLERKNVAYFLKNIFKKKSVVASLIIIIIIVVIGIYSGNGENNQNNSVPSNAVNTQVTSKNDLKKSIDSNTEELKGMETDLNNMSESLQDEETNIEQLKEELDSNNENGQTDEVNNYNDKVNKYNSDLEDYNQLYSSYKSLHDETNSMISKYNAMN